MSQHDFNIANQTASNARADINNALGAIATNNSGTTQPSVTYANQWWYDSSSNILKIRSEADDAWINVGYLDQSTNEFKPYVGSTQITAFLDEDTMTSNSATAVPSQQSVKAYVDSNTGSSVSDIKDDGVLEAGSALAVTNLDDYGIVEFGWSHEEINDSTNVEYARVRMSNDNGLTWGSWENLNVGIARENKASGNGYINMRTGLIVGTGSTSTKFVFSGAGTPKNLNTTLLSGGGNALQFEVTGYIGFFFVKSDGGRTT